MPGRVARGDVQWMPWPGDREPGRRQFADLSRTVCGFIEDSLSGAGLRRGAASAGLSGFDCWPDRVGQAHRGPWRGVWLAGKGMMAGAARRSGDRAAGFVFACGLSGCLQTLWTWRR